MAKGTITNRFKVRCDVSAHAASKRGLRMKSIMLLLLTNLAVMLVLSIVLIV